MRTTVTLIQALAFLVVLGVGAAAEETPALPAASPYPKLSTAEANNLDAAVDFIEQMGDKKLATKIRNHAKKGKISSADLQTGEPGTLGSTSVVTGDIEIDIQVITPQPILAQRRQSLTAPKFDLKNPEHSYKISQLAGTLIHEYTHSQQSFGTLTFSNLALAVGDSDGVGSEFQAYVTELSASGSWFRKLQHKLKVMQKDGAPVAEQVEIAKWIKGIASHHVDTLSAFVTEHKYGTTEFYVTDDPSDDKSWKPLSPKETRAYLNRLIDSLNKLIKDYERSVARETVRQAIQNATGGALLSVRRPTSVESLGPTRISPPPISLDPHQASPTHTLSIPGQ